MNERVAKLVTEYRGKVRKYKLLPREAKLAIAQYLSLGEGFAPSWEPPPEVTAAYCKAHPLYYNKPVGKNKEYCERMADANEVFYASLPKYVERNGEVLFGYVPEIPMQALIESVMSDEDLLWHETWDEYHRWYMSYGTKHAATSNKWPVFLSSADYDETLEDGWTRFHQYAERRLKMVPAVYLVPRPDL